MKFLIVHEVSYLSKIIYEFQILPEILTMQGHEVTVVDYDDSWQQQNGPVWDLAGKVHRNVHRAYSGASVTVRRPGMIRAPVLSRISVAVTSAIEVHKVLRSQEIDTIILYGLPTVGAQTLLAARATGVPIFFRSIDILHRLVPSSLLVPPTRLLERIIYNAVDGVSCVTPHLKKHVESYGVPASAVEVLPSGVDGDMFYPGPGSGELLRRWNIADNDPVVLFMGTMYRFSGLDRVINDFPKLLMKHPTARLLIAGCGEDETRLKRLVSEMNLFENVIFTGLLPYAVLPDLIRSSDVCINPFELNGITQDILPTKLFQYLACAKPVVATRLPGTVPFLAGEEHGVIYAQHSDFVDSVSDLLGSRSRMAQMGADGEKTCRREYDWRTIAQKFVHWIDARSN